MRYGGGGGDVILQIDPLKMRDKKLFKQNMDSLLYYIDVMMECVYASIRTMPPTIRHLMFLLGQSLSVRFTGDKLYSDLNDDERLTITNGISSFLFLRFFCRALMMPDDYGLLDSGVKYRSRVSR